MTRFAAAEKFGAVKQPARLPKKIVGVSWIGEGTGAGVSLKQSCPEVAGVALKRVAVGGVGIAHGNVFDRQLLRSFEVLREFAVGDLDQLEMLFGFEALDLIVFESIGMPSLGGCLVRLANRSF
jgi:hypothetical protein